MSKIKKNDEARIAVYTCYCGGNISDTVKCEKVREALEKSANVVVSRTDMSLCSDAGQAIIEEDIKEHGINRVVIGACAPSLHETTFRGTVKRAGLNPYLYQHVGLREQDSWVHHGDPHATEKAITLMNAGIAKVRLLKPLEPFQLDARQHALVIGGGVAGLTAAKDISRQGLEVTLIEKSPFLGGRIAQLGIVFPTGSKAQDGLAKLIKEVVSDPMITVYTGAELTTLGGYIGDFHAGITIQPRGVSEGYTAEKAVFDSCPVEVPDEFNYGLTTRKAIYQPYDGSYPNTPAIDWKNCTLCGECVKVAGKKNIKLDGKAEEKTIDVGAVVVATGFKPYEPREGEYGYGSYPEVVTLPQLIRLLEMSDGQGKFEYNGHPIKNVGFIHCVGSRHIPGVNEPLEDGKVNDYCSRVCCSATLHVANEIKERFPGLVQYDFYEDIRTYGPGHEEYYEDALGNEMRFLRFHADDAPEVVAAEKGEKHPLLIKVRDHNTWGMEIEVPLDMVVLAVGMMPNPIEDIVKLLKINVGTDRFLAEVHPKLRPVETAVPGVVLAGTAQGPMNIQESCAAAASAASKVAVLLGKGTVTLEPFVAAVNTDKCNGSGKCVEICPYEDAIALETVEVQGKKVKRAVVTAANCSGCGACVSACPNQAIDLQGWTIEQYDAMVDAIAIDLPQLEVAHE